MMWRSHLASGAFVAGLASVGLGELNPALVTGVLIGSLLPDVDHPKSKFGRVLLPISLPLYLVFGHRGGTHSVLFVALCGFVSIFNVLLGVGLALGVIVHILGDVISYSHGPVFTKGGGCPLAYPSEKKWGFRILKVNGLTENLVLLPALCIGAFGLFAQF